MSSRKSFLSGRNWFDPSFLIKFEVNLIVFVRVRVDRFSVPLFCDFMFETSWDYLINCSRQHWHYFLISFWLAKIISIVHRAFYSLFLFYDVYYEWLGMNTSPFRIILIKWVLFECLFYANCIRYFASCGLFAVQPNLSAKWKIKNVISHFMVDLITKMKIWTTKITNGG